MKTPTASWAYQTERTRAELAQVWEDHIRGRLTLTDGAEYVVPSQIARLNAEARANGASQQAGDLQRKVSEYRDLVLDILDAVDRAADLAALRRDLDTFDVEEKPDKDIPLALWREGMIRREAVKAA